VFFRYLRACSSGPSSIYQTPREYFPASTQGADFCAGEFFFYVAAAVLKVAEGEGAVCGFALCHSLSEEKNTFFFICARLARREGHLLCTCTFLLLSLLPRRHQNLQTGNENTQAGNLDTSINIVISLTWSHLGPGLEILENDDWCSGTTAACVPTPRNPATTLHTPPLPIPTWQKLLE
jgi:hypothetical protein